MGELRTIIIDTREQTPWGFPPETPVKIGTLKTGDYALEGDKHFAIERKSKGDFLGTISTGWPRFCRELNRMDEAEFIANVIIVECDFMNFCFSESNGEIIPPDHEHFMLTPQFIFKRISQLTLRGVSVLFAGDALKASALAYSIFKERNEYLNNEDNND